MLFKTSYDESMFRWIEGQIIDTGLQDLVIKANAIGYRIFCTPNTINHFKINDTAKLWLYTSVKENAIDIYGFLDKKELNFFELLLTINGVGPKSAISILGSSNLEAIYDGLHSGDANYFSKVTGIGKKTAEKIMLGLKDKIGILEKTEKQNSGSFAIDALTALGYLERDAREVVQKIKNKENTEEIVREALKLLNKK
jgi:Holliday junction DNA helicase RuvA